MNFRVVRSSAAGLAALFIAGNPGSLRAQTTGVLREVYTGITGVAVADLTNAPAFPSSPSSVEILSTFEAPVDVGDYYGQRLSAYLLPPTTGTYTFWVASDDNSMLFLSNDSTPANKALIASVPGWTASREWTKYVEQVSAPVWLTGGQKYYVEALMKEHSGGDNLAVRWQLPDGTMEEPIPGSRLQVYGLTAPQITQQPASQSVTEGGSATFAVQLAWSYGATYQWQRGTANIAGATGSAYTLGLVAFTDNGAQFRCIIANGQGSTNSAYATLTVLRDTTPPTITSVGNLGDNTLVTVTFSEPVEAATGTAAGNYTINNGVNVSAASFAGNTSTIILKTTPLARGVSYTLTVNNVRDRASAPNTIAPNTQRTFSIDFTPLDIANLALNREPLGPSTRRTGLAISEIMYHPTNRPDAKELEFIELYNSQVFPEDLSGFRLTGDVDYTFPFNTTIAAGGYLVVAPVPADVQSVYGITGVLGGFTNRLSNGSGTIRLRNAFGAVLLEARFSGDPPWPVATDGAGHSLVLARPTYGEGNPQACEASDLVGGTPGRAEAIAANPYRSIVINEFLAHTDPPDWDYIELYNYSSAAVNLTGCILTDSATSNRFVLPSVTIPARGFVTYYETNMGFALSAAGETIYFKNPAGTKVIDAVRFKGQENGVATGRYPDGAPGFYRLLAKTPGAANSRIRTSDIVLNELMYHPLSGDSADEFIEIFNRGVAAVNLGGWRLSDGVSFTFPTNATIPPGGYVVVANQAAHLMTNYAGLTANNTFGDYGGNLGNGERVALSKPDTIVSTNSSGVIETNLIHITVDEVTFGRGGRWGQWADGGGSSLELVDAHSDHRLAPNWADSDETTKSAWTNIEYTGVLDNGSGTADTLHILLQGAGECLVDNVEVFKAGGANLVANPGFESNFDGWFFQGTHDQSYGQTTGGYGGGKCLHVVASGRGDTGANHVRATLNAALSPGDTVTLRAKVRWLKGNPEILLRLHGNWLEAYGNIAGARNLGTPGAANTRAVTNTGPAIHDVCHSPVLPAASQAVTLRAQVGDPDGVASLVLRYRLDPATNYTDVSMAYNGAGLYSGTIPGQAAGTLVAFYIQASDYSQAPVTTLFPKDAPSRECLVRFGETLPNTGRVGTYRFWITQATINRWSSREKNSNEPLDATFVYNDYRVVYNAGTLYSGSPWHTPGYNGPLGSICDYILIFPEDDLMLGTTDYVLASLGNLDNDSTTQREQAAFWMLGQMGVPTLYRRPVNLYVNGQQRGLVYEDAQQPSGDIVKEWFSNDSEGDLHKIEDWFEFDNTGDNKLFNVDATLQNFTTTGGAKKLARYRWNWRKRAVTESANDYAAFFGLVDAVNAVQPEPFTAQVQSLVDYEEWARVMAVEHLAGNWDSYGYNRGKNMYAYKPQRGKWTLLAWDIDFVFDNGGDGWSTDMTPASMPINDGVMRSFLSFAPIQRAWWRALQDAVNGPLLDANVSAMMNAKYQGLAAAGLPVSDPSGALAYIASRRSYIQSLLANYVYNFSITTPNNLSTNRNYVSISGTAPIAVSAIRINGVEFPVTWTSVSSWSAVVALRAGVNVLNISGYDPAGNAVAGSSGTFTITYSGSVDLPQDHLVINEIMYNPALPDASFIELYNTSQTYAFDLSGWRLDGAGFTFPGGRIIAPGGFIVIANDPAGFGNAYGKSIPVAGIFEGKLKNTGETLKLVQPGVPPGTDVVIDQVTYSSAPPWPAAANGYGPSLQLIDPNQDNDRVMNWAVAGAGQQSATPGTTNSVRANLSLFPLVWLNEVQPNNVSGVRDNFGDRDPWVELFNSSTNAIDLSSYYLSDSYSNLVKWQFPAGTSIKPREFRLVWLDNEPGETSGTNLHANFRASSTNGSVVMTRISGSITNAIDYLNYGTVNNDRSYGAFPDGTPSQRRTFFYATPGATNDNSWPAVPVVVNEWMASNTRTIADADGKFSDWFELYNAGPATVDLSGYYLANSVTNPTQSEIPSGYTIPSGGFLLVWADKDAGQNLVGSPLHVDFKLSASGETIALFSPAGVLLESVTFGAQTNDISQGRWPDGNSGQYYFMPTPTPGRANVLGVPTNHPPTLASIPNQTAYQGSQLTFIAAGTDPDAGQTLTYSLDPGAPPTAFINPDSGIFTWTPTQADPPATYPVTIRVTDDGSPPASATTTVFITVVEPPPLRFGTVTLNPNGTLTLSWPTQPQKTYRVSCKTNLNELTWTTLYEQTATGTELSFQDNPSGVAQRFYRIELLNP